MASNSTLKRKYSTTTESTLNEIGSVADADSSPNKRMRMECSVNDEETTPNTSTRRSSPTSIDIDEEEENEVLVILIPRDDDDSTEADDVESDGERDAETTDSKESHPCGVQGQERGEDRDHESEQTETLEQLFSAPQRLENEFYCGSRGPPSRSLSPSVIFCTPLPSRAEPSNISDSHQAQEEEDTQPVPVTKSSPISRTFNPSQPCSPLSSSILDVLRTLRRKYHPSPNSDQSTRSFNANESPAVLDDTADTSGEDVDLDLIWAMFNGTASTAAGEAETDNRSEYPVYIEEMNLPELEDTVTSVVDGDCTAGPENHKVWWEHEDRHLSEEPPPLRPEIEEDEDEEDPEARLRRLVREGEMASDDGT